MNCTFPCKKEIKKAFKKNIKSKQCNIRSLKNDGEVAKCYSDALDKALEDNNTCNDIDEHSDKITRSIQNSSEKTIPTKQRLKENKRWVNENFLHLIQKIETTPRKWKNGMHWIRR